MKNKIYQQQWAEIVIIIFSIWIEMIIRLKNENLA